MCCSATASSSAVVTPGRTASRSSSSVSATTRPARRIACTCSGVLYSIMRSRLRNTARRSAHRGKEPTGDLVDLASAIDLNEQPTLGIELRQRCRLLGVDLKSAADDRLVVFGTSLLRSAADEASHDLVLVDGDLEHSVELGACRCEHGVELIDLRRSAWIAVEEEAGRCVRLGKPVTHHRVRQRVRDVVDAIHVRLGLATEAGAAGDVGAEDVAGRDGGDPEPL